MERKFYATYGSGHSGFPGYILVNTTGGDDFEARTAARAAVFEFTGGKFCGFYTSKSDLHELDNIQRDVLKVTV